MAHWLRFTVTRCFRSVSGLLSVVRGQLYLEIPVRWRSMVVLCMLGSGSKVGVEITNHKSQISNKSQWLKFKIQNQFTISKKEHSNSPKLLGFSWKHYRKQLLILRMVNNWYSVGARFGHWVLGFGIYLLFGNCNLVLYNSVHVISDSTNNQYAGITVYH